MKKIESFVKIPTTIARNSAISPMAKALYMAIKSYNPAFPSYRKLCKDTGIKSKTTLRKYLNELIFLQLLKIKNGGYNQSNHYEILDSPFFGQTDQLLNSPMPNTELRDVQNLDSNKNKLNISIKSQEDSSAIASEDTLGRPVNAEELSQSISNILNGHY